VSIRTDPVAAGLLALTLSATLVAGATAQVPQVGLVERILEGSGRPIPTTEHASILRREGAQPVRAETPLFLRDLVRVTRRDVLLDLRFVRADLASRAILGTRLDQVGTYEIGDTTVAGVSRLQLVVRQGVLVIEHAAGEIEAVAAGIRARITATTVLVQVDPTESSGIVYLREGTMHYPDYDLTVTEPNSAWVLRRGERPEPLMLAPAAHRLWQREIAHNVRSAWRPPLWQRPGFYIPAAAAVVGGGVYLLTRNGESATGTVIITIPQ
jgi:hypothetical protein